jgi:hypothetical protein
MATARTLPDDRHCHLGSRPRLEDNLVRPKSGQSQAKWPQSTCPGLTSLQQNIPKDPGSHFDLMEASRSRRRSGHVNREAIIE